MGKLGKSFTETNRLNFYGKETNFSLTLLNTYFCYYNYISIMFFLKRVEGKHLSGLPLCIVLPSKFINDVRVTRTGNT